MDKATSNYDRIRELGVAGAERVAFARRSAMLEFAVLLQLWSGLERVCHHQGYDVFKAWGTDAERLAHQLRDQLMWMSNFGREGRENGLHMASTALLANLKEVAREDASTLESKGRTYGDSWKKRGGVGAFMMLCRKWDRIENIAGTSSGHSSELLLLRNPGNILDDIGDLRCYLLLVEDEMIARRSGEQASSGYVQQ